MRTSVSNLAVLDQIYCVSIIFLCKHLANLTARVVAALTSPWLSQWGGGGKRVSLSRALPYELRGGTIQRKEGGVEMKNPNLCD